MSTAAVDAINLIRNSQRSQNHKTGERPLWQASPEPVKFTHNAMDYVIPPQGVGRMPGDRVDREYDGTLLVYDVYGIDPKQAKSARLAAKRAEKEGGHAARKSALDGFPRRVNVSSLEIVEHAVKKLAARGVVALTGDPQMDEELKAVAKAAWREFRRLECEGILARYDQKRAAFYAQPRNADLPPPAMTPRETQAFVDLTEYQLGQSNEGNKLACVAPQCPFRHEDAQVMADHMIAWHPTMDGVAAKSEDETPKRKPGRPKRQEAGAA
jgi:hypothetical protein